MKVLEKVHHGDKTDDKFKKFSRSKEEEERMSPRGPTTLGLNCLTLKPQKRKHIVKIRDPCRSHAY